MARSHARILTEIWDDEDFLLCSANAQRLYLMLLSQPELGHSGLLSITIRRWSGLAADTPREVLEQGISELAATRFVLVDADTEELLIRSMVRNDGVWKQPKILAVALIEASRMRSRRLRACFVQELERIEVNALPPKTRGDVEALLKDLPKTLVEARDALHAQAPPHPPEDPPPYPPAQVPAYPPRGRGVSNGGTEGNPPVPKSPSDSPPAAQAPPPPHGTQDTLDGSPPPEPSMTVNQRAKRITDVYSAAVPMCAWNAVNQIVIRAIKAEKWTDAEVEKAMLALADSRRPVSVNTLAYELAPPDNVHKLPANGQNGASASRGGARKPVNDIDWSQGFKVGGRRR